MAIYFTDIIGNKGDIGSALKLQGRYYSACENAKSMSVRLINVSINAISPNEATLHYGTAAVYVNIIHWLVLEDTCFYNNTGGGVYANNSDIVLVGRVVFEYNFGHSGGAIELDSYTHCDRQSFLQLMSSIIANNRALEYGGGVGISEERSYPTFCFYQIQDINRDPHGFIEMKDNHADIAGDDIYGVGTMQCQLYANNYYEEKTYKRGLNLTLFGKASIPLCLQYRQHPTIFASVIKDLNLPRNTV